MFEVHQPFRISPDTHSRPQTPPRHKPGEDEDTSEEQPPQGQEAHHLPPSAASGNCIDIVA